MVDFLNTHLGVAIPWIDSLLRKETLLSIESLMHQSASLTWVNMPAMGGPGVNAVIKAYALWQHPPDCSVRTEFICNVKVCSIEGCSRVATVENGWQLDEHCLCRSFFARCNSHFRSQVIFYLGSLNMCFFASCWHPAWWFNTPVSLIKFHTIVLLKSSWFAWVIQFRSASGRKWYQSMLRVKN